MVKVSGKTVTVNVCTLVHCVEAGVNVYVFVVVLLTLGDHVPTTPFKDVVGKTGAVSP